MKILRRIVPLSVLAVMVIILSVTATSMTSHASEIQEENNIVITNSEDSSSEVVSYVDIFQNYYNLVLEEVYAQGVNNVCSFAEFCDKYYESNLDLPSYTESVIRYSKYEDADDELIESVTENTIISSGDAYYILPQVDYNVTPVNAFAQEPVYSLYDYSSLQNGDIIHETKTIFFNAGHTAIVYDMTKPSGYGEYIQTMEAVGSGVTFGFLDDSRMVDFGVVILRVQGATATDVIEAKYFCYEQLGKNYFLNIFRLNTDIDSASWYCSEMIYAAYYYAGIDIGVKKDSNGNDVYLSLGCLPGDINNSYNIYSAHIPGFLDISIIGKAGTKWTIEVFNYHNYDIVFEYNTKMCFKGDAESWSGLNHLEEETVFAGDSVPVVISENLFATSIVFSWVDQDKRFITYGYQLNANGNMTVVYASILL